MTKKFILTNEVKIVNGHALHRIEAIRNLNNVKVGDKGGFIDNEHNLDHHGDCWVYGDAIVMDNAYVTDNAVVKGNAEVIGNALIKGDAIVQDNAMVSHNAVIGGNAVIKDNGAVIDNSHVIDNGVIEKYGIVRDKAIIEKHARVTDYGHVKGYAVISCDAIIKDDNDYIPFRQWWNNGQICTWTRSNNKWNVYYTCYTGQELVDEAYKSSDTNGREFARIVNYVQDILGQPHIERSK